MLVICCFICHHSIDQWHRVAVQIQHQEQECIFFVFHSSTSIFFLLITKLFAYSFHVNFFFSLFLIAFYTPIAPPPPNFFSLDFRTFLYYLFFFYRMVLQWVQKNGTVCFSFSCCCTCTCKHGAMGIIILW